MGSPLLKLLALHSRVLRVHSLLPRLLGSDSALPPAIVQLELTHRCNLNCPMCYQARAGAEGELTTEEWKRVIDSLPRWALVTLTGGDPFMRADIDEILSYALGRHRCNMLTNGELLTPERAARMIEGKLSLVGISIDGPAAVHDQVRRKPGLFDKVRANISALQAEKKRRGSRWPLLDIKTVILPENVSSVTEVFDLAKELGADYWSLSLPKTSDLQFSNRYTDDQDAVLRSKPGPTMLPASARAELMARIREAAAAKDGPIVRFYPYGMLSEAAAGKHLDNSLSGADFEECRLPWSFACVSPRGDVFPCLCCRMGNVREAALPVIWNGEKFRAFRGRLGRGRLRDCCLGCCYSVYRH